MVVINKTLMASLSALVCSLLLGGAGVSRAEDGPPTGLGLARVSYQQGDVLFRSSDTDGWVSVARNLSLMEEDRVWAGDKSRAEIKFVGGAAVYLNRQSQVDIVKLRHDNDGDLFQVGLASGDASFAVRNFGKPDSVFQVDTQSASVRASGKARFRVTVLGDGATDVGVSSGSVQVESDQGITDVDKGDLLQVSPDGRTRILDLPRQDGWDKWVASRQKTYDRPAVSSRYLPRDMDDYAQELDNKGRWRSYAGQGNVWIPSVAAGWSPYSNGRWVWSGGDYVWLSYDPWYAPFHYGRWTWAASTGWYWVPPQPDATFWSPGYVGWGYGPSSVYWVPLAPRETYYGYGNYGPGSVNVIHQAEIAVPGVFVNARLGNAVVAVEKVNFLRGKNTRIKITEARNPFLHKGVNGARLIGRPPVQEIKPTRDTRVPMPGVKLSKKALPPARLDKQAQFIKQRSVVRTPDNSAFKPGRKPERLKETERVKGPGRMMQQRPQGRTQPREQVKEQRRAPDEGVAIKPVKKPGGPKEPKMPKRMMQQRPQERTQTREPVKGRMFQQPQERTQQRQQMQQQPLKRSQQERIQPQERTQQREQIKKQKRQKPQESAQPREQTREQGREPDEKGVGEKRHRGE